MPIYEHLCETCTYEWEDEYSIKADPPDTCPNCKSKTVKRLISLGGKGVVELTGQDLIDKCKSDAKKIQIEASKDENTYANLLGYDKYHELQTKIDRRKRKR
jgi:putative FmdB family regulatory protein